MTNAPTVDDTLWYMTGSTLPSLVVDALLYLSKSQAFRLQGSPFSV